MFGLPSLSMLSVAEGAGTRPTNTEEDMTALQKLYAAASAHNRTPNGRVARGWDQFNPMSGTAPSMLPSPPTPAPVNLAPPAAPQPPALSPQAMSAPMPAPAPAAVPMPAPRPTDAPQAPAPMSFLQRNSAMMRDPGSGAFIDPANAQRAQATGPDVINKLLDMFHKKDA